MNNKEFLNRSFLIPHEYSAGQPSNIEEDITVPNQALDLKVAIKMKLEGMPLPDYPEQPYNERTVDDADDFGDLQDVDIVDAENYQQYVQDRLQHGYDQSQKDGTKSEIPAKENIDSSGEAHGSDSSGNEA